MRVAIPFAVLVLVAALLASIGGGRGPAELTCIQGSDAFTLDAQRMSWQHDIRLGRSIYETLVANEPAAGGIVPSAAESWEVSPDGRTWTFRLRADGRWSNGDAVTAHDFVAAWRRAILPDCGSDYAGFFYEIEGARELASWRAAQLAAFAALPAAERTVERAEALRSEADARAEATLGLRAVDDRTLEMRLRRRVPYWLELVAFPPMSPMHRASYARFRGFDAGTGRERVGTAWTKPGNLVTNGPYQVVEWRYRQSMRLEPNPHHRLAASGMPRSVEIVPVEDNNTAVLAFDAGGVDWLLDVRASYKTELAEQGRAYLDRHRASLEALLAEGADFDAAVAQLPPPGPGERRDVHSIASFGTDFFSFNCRPALVGDRLNPFADPAVRRAFALSIDKRSLAERVVRLGEPVASTLVPPGSIAGYVPPDGLGFDPQRAREELASAGWEDRNGDGVPERDDGTPFPTVEVLYSSGNPRYRDLSLAMADMWRAALSVPVETRGKDAKFFKEDLKSGNFMVARGSWFGDYGDPTTFLELSRTGDGNNDRGYSCAEFDALLDRADAEPDPARRMQVLAEAERLLMERDLPILPLSHLSTMYLYDPCRVRGVARDPSLDQRFQSIRLIGR